MCAFLHSYVYYVHVFGMQCMAISIKLAFLWLYQSSHKQMPNRNERKNTRWNQTEPQKRTQTETKTKTKNKSSKAKELKCTRACKTPSVRSFICLFHILSKYSCISALYLVNFVVVLRFSYFTTWLFVCLFFRSIKCILWKRTHTQSLCALLEGNKQLKPLFTTHIGEREIIVSLLFDWKWPN